MDHVTKGSHEFLFLTLLETVVTMSNRDPF